MAKRHKGHQPFDPHPDRPWMPDVPGHQNSSRTNQDIKYLLDNQIEELKRELGVGTDKNSPEGGRSGERRG